MEVKQVLTGYGRADKKEVEQMVRIALQKECLPKLKSILEKYGLPTAKYDYKEYSNAIMYDKKNLAGVLRIIFIKNFGEVFMKEFKESDLN